jgi:Ca2+-binding RTX toxin-like protein
MRMHRFYRMFWIALLLLVSLSIFSAFAAANTVAVSGAEDTSSGITVNDLRPQECDSINLENIVTGNGTFQGTNRNDLILGSAGNDSIRGMGGDDCILGGGGNDTIDGRQGNDILLGGPGDDDLSGFSGTDICYGGLGTDTADSSCEITYEIP